MLRGLLRNTPLFLWVFAVVLNKILRWSRKKFGNFKNNYVPKINLDILFLLLIFVLKLKQGVMKIGKFFRFEVTHGQVSTISNPAFLTFGECEEIKQHTDYPKVMDFRGEVWEKNGKWEYRFGMIPKEEINNR